MKKIGVKNTNEFIQWFLNNRQSCQDDGAELIILRRRMPSPKNDD